MIKPTTTTEIIASKTIENIKARMTLASPIRPKNIRFKIDELPGAVALSLILK
jgi:hypothetical protein